MNRINIFATMGFTGLAIAMTLLGTSDNPDIKTWAILVALISLLIALVSYVISGRVDKKDKRDRETIISEFRKANKNLGKLVKVMGKKTI